MVTRIGGARRKTRNLMKKGSGARGKMSLRRYLQTFDPGMKVALALEPSVQKGIFHRRFAGKVGVVARQQGSCYVVKLSDGGKDKEIVVHPVHLKAV